MKFKKIFFTVFLSICICMILGLFLSFLTQRFVRYSPVSCTESAKELQNPYIGWYQIHGYKLSEEASFDISKIRESEEKAGLVLLEFNLQDYAAGPIGDRGLALLNQLLHCWQSTDRQLIVRFFYDWDGNAMSAEPQELSIILTHMSQTSEIVNRYKDCVYIMQGIFIGSWGEIHGSRYANDEDMKTLISHLASVTAPEIFLAVRTPQQWRLLTDSAEPLNESGAFQGTLSSRLSLFNDGMLGSDTDLNTYAAAPAPEGFPFSHKRSRQEEIEFQNRLCAYVPNGGEVVIPNPCNDFPAAVRDLKATRVSYLNSAYDEAVFSKWRNAFCTEDPLFSGMNGFDYISRHLGYRYVLRSSECTSVLPWEKDTELTVTLQNTGFSGCYRPFDVALTLREPVTDRSFTLPVKTDTRSWDPGVQIHLSLPIRIREYATGTYDLYLKISDPVSGRIIELANEEASNEYGYALGQLDISIFPR